MQESSRFLIALAKFLGINPTEAEPLKSVLLSAESADLLKQILVGIFQPPNGFSITFEDFNRLMIICGRHLATPHFFDYFFGEAASLEQFETAVEKFRVKAMWLFGDFRFGYRMFATCPQPKFEDLIQKTLPLDPQPFSGRERFVEIEDIPSADLHLLGYISGAQVADMDSALKILSLASEWSGATPSDKLSAIGSDKRQKAIQVLKANGVDVAASDLVDVPKEKIKELHTQLSGVYDELKKRRDNAVAIGLRNTQRYLTLPDLDVYVATSMREPEDFLSHHRFIKEVFSDAEVAELRLRYFDPTLSYVENRVTKGLIEMLMLRRAMVTIYNAGTEDTLGKDSELAATLTQGKAVIVYVPATGKLRDGKIGSLDNRAKMFRVDHPLGLQINMRTGVAHGLIVVRTAKECATMLRKVMLRQREFTIRHEGGNFLLEENETKSILRIVSDDPLVSHAFWTYFRHTAPDED